MEVCYRYSHQDFSWNAAKAASNQRKHGVSFEKACEVFFDPFLKVVDASDGTESRQAALGLSEDWTALFVVHLIREDDAIRIISARVATAAERQDYEDG